MHIVTAPTMIILKICQKYTRTVYNTRPIIIVAQLTPWLLCWVPTATNNRRLVFSLPPFETWYCTSSDMRTSSNRNTFAKALSVRPPRKILAYISPTSSWTIYMKYFISWKDFSVNDLSLMNMVQNFKPEGMRTWAVQWLKVLLRNLVWKMFSDAKR